MKYIGLFLFLIFTSACGGQTVENRNKTANPQSAIPNPQSKQMVLVELFTSEGWSSCPPADRALAFLAKEQPVPQAEIVTLALHVDYWNYLGWKDEFSSPLFTQRQQFYVQRFKLGSAYTPQMVVDGATEFTGSDTGKAARAIAEAAKLQKGKVEITEADGKIKVKITELPEHGGANIFLAVTEDNLASNVRRGENSGKRLEHQSVVRELKSIGTVSSMEKTAAAEFVLQLQPGWKRENLKIIVFAQENESRKILGVGRFAFGKS